MRARGVRWFTIVLALVSVGVALALWLRGADFYLTHPWARMDHPDYASLRSSGAWGHGLGVIGTALLLMNLTFLLRRNLSSFRRFGSLRGWMDMHVATGLLGPLLIIYHSAFHPRSTVAIIASVSLGILVATGIVGRFIYAMIPRTVAGAELGRDALMQRLSTAWSQLEQVIPGDDPVWGLLERLSAEPRRVPMTRFGCLMLLPWFTIDRGLAHLRLRGAAASLRARHGEALGNGELLDELRDVVVIRKRLHVLAVYRRLMQWWRSMHRVFAVLMVLMLIIHVAVVLHFGYTGSMGAA